MSKLLIIFFFLFFAFYSSSSAQYFYKDILSSKQLIAELDTLKAHKIKVIDVHSFDPDGQPSKGFFCQKKISKDYRKIETYTKSFVSGKSDVYKRQCI